MGGDQANITFWEKELFDLPEVVRLAQVFDGIITWGVERMGNKSSRAG